MLSDEEKKAIEYWKTHMEILHWNTQLASEHYIKVLLDLIEKQKEKNKNLEDELNKYIIKMSDEEYRRLVDIIRDEISKEWKDKIKAKIEELENGNKNTFIRGEKILVLQSLLKKE